MKSDPEFIMTVGIPGCGKSTYLKKNSRGRFIVSPDNIRRELYDDISEQSNQNVVWSRAIGRIEGALLIGGRVILDATNTKFSEWSGMIRCFPQCRKVAWVFDIDPEVAYQRICSALNSGIDRSVVPEEVIYKYYGQLQYTLKKLPDYFDEIEIINA